MSFRSLTFVSSCAFAMISASAMAAEPSNAEVMKMLQDLQSKVEKLEQENKALKVQVDNAGGKQAGINDYSDLLAPKKKRSGDWQGSIGLTPMYVMGDATNFVRSGSSSSGINGVSDGSEQVNHSGIPSIDLSLSKDFVGSQWGVNANASIFRNVATSDYTGSASDKIIPAFGLSSNAAVRNVSGKSELTRVLVGANAEFAFIETDKSGLALEFGANSAFIQHNLAIDTDAANRSDNRMSFTGVGPRFGVNANYGFDNGIGFKGGVAGNLLVGYSKMSQEQIAASERTSEHDYRVVPVFEINAAGTYQPKDSNINIEMGLKGEYWTNLADWYTATHNASVNPSRSGADDLAFFGPFVKVSMGF